MSDRSYSVAGKFDGPRNREPRLLLYGAYGYTGRLVAERAAVRALAVVLGGGNEDALSALGARLNLQTRVVGLDDHHRLAEALNDIACVVHMAGPFAATATPMLDACLATGTNYVDISGEIEVFEALYIAHGHSPAVETCVVPAWRNNRASGPDATLDRLRPLLRSQVGQHALAALVRRLPGCSRTDVIRPS